MGEVATKGGVCLNGGKFGQWPSGRGPISRIRPSHGYGSDAVPLSGVRWYGFHGFGGHLGNVGLVKSFQSVTGSCDDPVGLDVSSAETIGPDSNGSYRICGDLTVRPSGSLIMQPGTYYVDGGNVLFQGDVTGIGGVTIVLTGATATDVGTIDIRAQSNVVLRAPSSGNYAGIAVYQVDFAGTTGDNKFNGGATLDIDGAIYIKNQKVIFNGGSDIDTEGCTVIVARMVKFSGTSHIRNTASVCSAVGLDGNSIAAQKQVVLLQ